MRHKKIIIALTAAALLTSCTYVRYASDNASLTVIDLHPSGEAIDLSGALDGKGTLDVNREQGSNAEVVTKAIEAYTQSVTP